MKRFNLFFIAVMLLGGMVMAQPGSGRTHKNVSPETRAAKMTERMTKELSLNDKQAKEVEALNLEFVTQMAANRFEKPAKRDSSCCKKQDKAHKQGKKEKDEMKKMRGNMKEARDAREAKLKNILTQEQFAKYQKENEQREERMRSDKRNNN